MLKNADLNSQVIDNVEFCVEIGITNWLFNYFLAMLNRCLPGVANLHSTLLGTFALVEKQKVKLNLGEYRLEHIAAVCFNVGLDADLAMASVST